MAKPVKTFLVLIMAASLWFAGCSGRPAKKTRKLVGETGKTETSGGVETMFSLKSPVFEDKQTMPAKYANKGVAGGQNISIPLAWENVPEGTKSFAIAMIDRHPIANNWVHWLVVDIPTEVTSLPEGASNTSKMPAGSKELFTTYGSKGYGGPQPPSGSGVHDYEVTIYALRTERLGLTEKVPLNAFLSAVKENALGTAKLVGKFSR